MDGIEVEKSLYDISDGDLKDLWGSDSFDSNMGDIGLGSEPDWTNLLDHQPIILHDRMMSDAVQSPRIQSEHSYSLTSVGDEMPDSPLEALHQNIKLEDYGKDMDTECFPTMPLGGSSAPDYGVVVKREPSSPPPSRSCSSSPSFGLPASRNSTISALLASPTTFQQQHHHHHQQQQQQSGSGSGSSASHSLLKPPTILLATRPQQEQRRIVYPKVNIKLESVVSSPGFSLPPTPPSSTGSDSEGSLSPVHGTTSSCLNPASPPSLLLTGSAKRTGQSSKVSSGGRLSSSSSASSSSSSSHSSLISSQPKGSTGILMLTEEEKRTLLAEGYPIPQKLPLSKAEERSLKKIRRKIKNKISAQESRRKKKEYVDALEKKVEVLSNENNEYKRRVDSLEGSNKSLLVQLQKLQALLGRDMPDKHSRSTSTQTSLDEELMDEDSNGYVQTVELMDLVNGDFKVNLGGSVTKRRYRGQLRSNC